MNTAAMTVTSVAPPHEPAAAQKQFDGSAADGAFGQMLTREISDRHQASNAAESKPDNVNDAKQAQANAPAKADNAAKPAQPEKTDSKSKKEDDKDSDKNTDANTAANTTTPADMLAVMMNAAHGAGKPADVSAKSAAPADAAARALEKTTADTAAKIAADGKATKAGDQTLSAEDATASGKDFSAQLQKAGDAAQKSESGASKAALSSAEIRADALRASDTKHEKIPDMPPAGAAAGLAALQQAAALHSGQPAASASGLIAPQVGSPGWDNALSQKVVWMVAGDQQSATLTLNPPDLGPLQVVLNVSNSMADATFVTAHPDVRHALESAMPKLREMMSQAGIQLGQANVNTGTPNGNHTPGNQAGSHSSSSSSSSSSMHAAPEIPVRTVRSQPLSNGQGLVDTFV